jgi:hypothetical protein
VFLDAEGQWERARPPYERPGVEVIHLRRLIDRRHGPQSIQRYAYDILDELFHLHAARISQDIAAVERAFHRLLGLVMDVTIKADWETDALFGRQVREDRRRGGKNRPRPDPQELQQRDRKLQQDAERMKKAHPHLSKRAIANHLGPLSGLKPNTARQKIVFLTD